MPDWQQQLHRRIEANGHTCDADVLAELATHATLAYEAALAESGNAREAEQQVHALIETWVREAGHLRRCSRRSSAIPPPAAGGSFLASVAQDVRYGLRLLGRQPGFAAAAILTMALGIGAATLVFSIAYGVLARPLPWPDAHQLVRLTEMRQGRTGRISGTVSNGTFNVWREHRTTIDDIGGWLTQTATLTGAGEAIRISSVPTTPSLFRILQVHPLLGRLFDEGEGASAQPGVALLSYGLWQERFGAQPDVIGRVLHLNERPYTIVGVMPRGFAFPTSDARVWTAWRVPPVTGSNGALAGVIFRATARLRTGVSPAQASAEATQLARQAPDMGLAARALFGAAGPIDVSAVRELEAITADVRPAILVSLAAVALLLVTATANVGSLQLARASTRRREITIRAAIGAGQARIVRQLLIENAIIGLCGAAGGFGLAAAVRRVLPSLLPSEFPRLDAVTLDLRVLLFALGVAMLTSVACGLLPAWHTRRSALSGALAEDGAAPSGVTRSAAARTHALIMAGQVATTCVLLVGGVLLARSLIALTQVDRGYDPVNVLSARLPLPPGLPAERWRPLLDGVTDDLRATPGVTAAAYSSGLPFVSSGGFAAFNMRSPITPDTNIEVQATRRLVSPGYFAAMRLRLVEGRVLSDTDGATAVPAIVVNRTFARQYLGARPLEVRIPQGGAHAGGVAFVNDQADVRVVGVVEDMRQDRVDAPPQPEMFALFQQVQPTSLQGFDPILVLRTDRDPARYVSTLRTVLRAHAPQLAVDSVMTMEDRVTMSLARPRLYAVVLTCVGTFALLIAGVGLFGLLSFSVAQRRREIGIRSALGAQTRDVVVLVLRQAVPIVSAGLLVGIGASLLGGRSLASLLYGVGPYDALTFVAVVVVIVAAAALACVVPARRAARVDPLAAIRHG